MDKQSINSSGRFYQEISIKSPSNLHQISIKSLKNLGRVFSWELIGRIATPAQPIAERQYKNNPAGRMSHQRLKVV